MPIPKIMTFREVERKSNEQPGKKLQEAFKKRFGFDPMEIKVSVAGDTPVPLREAMHHPLFSLRRMRESVESSCHKFREANPESAYQGLERGLVQNWSFGGFDAARVTYPDVFRVVPSTTFGEFYDPLFDGELPEILKNGEPIADSKLVGLETFIKNQELGRILSLPRTLFDRDKTGQIAQKVSNFGSRYREFIEMLCMACVHYIAFSASLPGGGKNKVATYGTTLTTLIPEALTNLRTMKDPLGNFYGHKADFALVGAGLEYSLLTVLNSTFYPAVPSANVGQTGWTAADNILKGMLTPQVSDKLPDNDCILGKAFAGGVWQEEVAMEVSQEAQNTGGDFDSNMRRFKNYGRGNSGIIDVRAFCAVNIDSVNVPTQFSDLQTIIAQTYSNIG